MKSTREHLLACVLLMLLLFLCIPSSGYAAQANPVQYGVIAIMTNPNWTSPEKVAADELKHYLSVLYPKTRFVLSRPSAHMKADGRIILGCKRSLEKLAKEAMESKLDGPESYVVTHRTSDGEPVGIILGEDPAGVVYGVYDLLEKLGCGFYLTFDDVPPTQSSFSFDSWSLADRPLTRIRLVFNWHNFLSGCTGWDLKQWKQWITQSQKMKYNTIMVHAYGNNPMFTFRFNNMAKRVGYISTTRRGRDWGNEHVNDVRRLPGGVVFGGPEFGSDAALVPNDQRIKATQTLMQKVFAHAEERGMNVCFAIDLDTNSMLPQDMIKSLPEAERVFNGRLWLPRPDTVGGYRYYKAQVDALFSLYPQIDFLALWRRGSAQEWGELKLEQFPESWRTEYEQYIARKPEAGKLPQSRRSFALGKVVRTFRKVLDDSSRKDVKIGMGSWENEWVPALNEFLPRDVIIMPLDSSCMRYRAGSFLRRKHGLDPLVAAKGRILPIIWAHHDDGEYIGRPDDPHLYFNDTLEEMDASGFGVIHWMQRPLDLFFKNHCRQVWHSSKNEEPRTTCLSMGRSAFGEENAEPLGEYLYQWWTGAPIFGRVTGDHFFPRREGIPDPERAIQECRKRIQILEQADLSSMTEDERTRLAYFKALESMIIAVTQAQELAYRPAEEALKNGEFDQARTLIARHDPVDAIRQFSHLSQMAGTDRGEEAMVVSLGTRWLTDFISLRQTLGMEDIRINYGPTLHEALAQGSGRYTFDVDHDRDFWSVRGERETSRPEIRTDKSVPAAGSSENIPGNVMTTGIAINQKTNLPITPLTSVQHNIVPGDYLLTVYAGAASGTESCRARFAAKIKNATNRVFNPTKARYLRIACHGNSENSWNSIVEIKGLPLDRKTLEKSITASSHVPDNRPAFAADGNTTTRWATATPAWIQIPLDPKQTFSHIDIEWYKGRSRTYRFDLLISDDGKTWKSLKVKQMRALQATDTIDFRNQAPNTPAVHIYEKELSVNSLTPLALEITPESDGLIIYGLKLSKRRVRSANWRE